MSTRVALYGITGALGREVLVALEVDHEGIERLLPIAGPRSAGENVRWQGASLSVLGVHDVALADVDLAILAVPAEVAQREGPRLVAAGARVIDATGTLARVGEPAARAPLVWPGLATRDATDYDVASAVALPSPLASTLAPILEAALAARITFAHVDVTALISASHAGRAGIDALSKQTVALLGSKSITDPRPFDDLLAFNVLATTTSDSVLLEERAATELSVLVPGAPVPSITTLWVPVFAGMLLSVTLRGTTPANRATIDSLTAAFSAHPDVSFEDPPAAPEARAEDKNLDEADGDDDDTTADEPVPEVLGMRRATDRDEVLVTHPTLTVDGAMRLVAFADPVRRTAVAAQKLLARFIAALEADA